jgi:hypothetical protein
MDTFFFVGLKKINTNSAAAPPRGVWRLAVFRRAVLLHTSSADMTSTQEETRAILACPNCRQGRSVCLLPFILLF